MLNTWLLCPENTCHLGAGILILIPIVFSAENSIQEKNASGLSKSPWEQRNSSEFPGMCIAKLEWVACRSQLVYPDNIILGWQSRDIFES